MTSISNANQSDLASAMQSGVQGYKNGSRIINDAAIDIANGSTNNALTSNRQFSGDSQTINQAAVSLIQGDLQAQASAKVISRVDGMIGTIIDTYA